MCEWHPQHNWVSTFPFTPDPSPPQDSISPSLSPKPSPALPEAAGGCRKHSHTTFTFSHSSNFIQQDATQSLPGEGKQCWGQCPHPTLTLGSHRTCCPLVIVGQSPLTASVGWGSWSDSFCDNSWFFHPPRPFSPQQEMTSAK